MTPKWNSIAVVAVLVLVVVALVSYSSTRQNTMSTTTGSVSNTTPPPPSLPEATGNIDDAAEAALSGILQEQSLSEETDADANLYTTDSQEINNLGQSYNENDL